MKIKDITLTALFTALCAVCAWITVPSSVPFTMQTFAVFLACLTLGGDRAAVCLMAYLLLGAAGVPVFSGFRGGIGCLFGPTGGYIIGFVVTCLVYYLFTRFLPDKKLARVLGLFAGLCALYIFGTVWFAFVYAAGDVNSFGFAFLKCVVPFIIPDIIKMILAFILSERLRKIINK